MNVRWLPSSRRSLTSVRLCDPQPKLSLSEKKPVTRGHEYTVTTAAVFGSVTVIVAFVFVVF